MSDLREYVITLRTHDDLDSFYEDMETLRPTKYGCMPERAVECCDRRLVSRNTHYLLTDEEAETLKNDLRIAGVSPSAKELGLEITPHWTETSANWNRGTDSTVNAHRNWGLYRSQLDYNLYDWGADQTASKSATVSVNASGKNVDVIINDGHLNPDHPEFAKNSNGTGGSRVIQFNWLSLNPLVDGTPAGATYTYTPYIDPNYGSNLRTTDNDHGCHVAGTSCGNTQGWARDANIYNINPYSTNQNYIPGDKIFDYIKVFHQQKAINPATGRKNPTICTNSWGYSRNGLISSISYISYGGQIIQGPFTREQAGLYDLFNGFTNGFYSAPQRVSYVDADIEDCIAAGIIMVGAAGNSYQKQLLPTDTYYNSFIKDQFLAYNTYYLRGGTPGASMITVGAMSADQTEPKASFSNCGPAIDIYAPGENILSSVNSNLKGGTYDSRNDQYLICKYNGTSMACPQVAGLLACALETYPNMSHADTLQYLLDNCLTDQMFDRTPVNAGDYYSLQGSPNRMLHFKQERPNEGNVYPKINCKTRPTSGQIWPRPRIYRYGPQS